MMTIYFTNAHFSTGQTDIIFAPMRNAHLGKEMVHMSSRISTTYYVKNNVSNDYMTERVARRRRKIAILVCGTYEAMRQ
jgi:hypothetical protein